MGQEAELCGQLLYDDVPVNGELLQGGDHGMDARFLPLLTALLAELYVIYTGSQQNIPDTLSLSNLYQGPGSAQLQVTVLRGGKGHDILSQYVRFCQIGHSPRSPA